MAPPGSFFYRIHFVNGVESVSYGPANEANSYTFGPDPIPNTVAASLHLFREANNLPRSSEAECLADIDAFTCVRLGGVGIWCFESAITQEQIVASYQPTGCRSCGHRIH